MEELNGLEEQRRKGMAPGAPVKRGTASNEMCTFLILNFFFPAADSHEHHRLHRAAIAAYGGEGEALRFCSIFTKILLTS